MQSSLLCGTCQNILTPDMVYCSKCGAKTGMEMQQELPMSKQISIYALSFFLPPLGLIPGIKYLKQPNDQIKRVGMIAIILTVISVVLSLWSMTFLYNQMSKSFQQYQNIESIQ